MVAYPYISTARRLCHLQKDVLAGETGAKGSGFPGLTLPLRDWGGGLGEGKGHAPFAPPPKHLFSTNPMKTTGWLFDLYPLGDRMVLWFITESGQRLRLEDNFPYCLYLGGPQARLKSLARGLGQKGWLRRAYPGRGRDLWTGREIPVVALEVKAYGFLPRVRQWLGTLPAEVAVLQLRPGHRRRLSLLPPLLALRLV